MGERWNKKIRRRLESRVMADLGLIWRYMGTGGDWRHSGCVMATELASLVTYQLKMLSWAVIGVGPINNDKTDFTVLPLME